MIKKVKRIFHVTFLILYLAIVLLVVMFWKWNVFKEIMREHVLPHIPKKNSKLPKLQQA